MKTIDDPRTERQLRTDDGEIDRGVGGERDKTIEVAGADIVCAGDSGDPRIARDADELAAVSRGGQGGEQRMLPRAATDDENPHYLNNLRAERGSNGRRPTGTISLTLTGFAP